MRTFYANARRKDGSCYTKNSMNAIRYGISRFLMAEKNLNITEDIEFCPFNRVFTALLVELKQVGKGKVNHHPEMTKEDLKKLYLYFDTTTPKGLKKMSF